MVRLISLTSLLIYVGSPLLAQQIDANKATQSEIMIEAGLSIEVVEVNRFGLLLFEDGFYIRLWGISPDVHALRNLVKGRFLRCGIPDKVTQVQRHSNVSHCVFSNHVNQSVFDDSPADVLLKEGSAVELCAESFDAFGNCGTEK